MNRSFHRMPHYFLTCSAAPVNAPLHVQTTADVQNFSVLTPNPDERRVAHSESFFRLPSAHPAEVIGAHGPKVPLGSIFQNHFT